jgi:hypothetical protein
MWAQVAVYIGQIVGNLADGYEERQIDWDLAELERLVSEILKEVKAEEAQAGTSGDQKPGNNSKPSAA